MDVFVSEVELSPLGSSVDRDLNIKIIPMQRARIACDFDVREATWCSSAQAPYRSSRQGKHLSAVPLHRCTAAPLHRCTAARPVSRS